MGRDGFSLVELVVVIGIIAVLLTIATLNFNSWLGRSNVEKEVKQLYSDLMYVRQQALVTGMTHTARFTSTTQAVFSRYSSEGDVAGTVVRSRDLPYAVTTNEGVPMMLSFSSRGMMQETTSKAVCVSSKYDSPLDSIFITQSRINMGKLINSGGSCAQANINLK